MPLDRIDSEPIGGELLRRRAGATRGWLKVQDGCDRKCSFCATRLARGASRSRPPGKVVAEARFLARVHPELVVTGIHIGHYGRDLDPRWTLARLVALSARARARACASAWGAWRPRRWTTSSSTSSPTSGGRLAPHLHMPLQSGADAVLRRMRRWHTREQYRRRAWRSPSGSGTWGSAPTSSPAFPGETERDHAETVALVEELPFTYLHVFPYSPREGTGRRRPRRPGPAAGRRRARAASSATLAQEKGRAYRAARLGGGASVVLEGRGGTALTGDYLRVAAPDAPPSRGGLLDGTLRGTADHLYIAWPLANPTM